MCVFHCIRPRWVGTAVLAVLLLGACQQVPMLPGLSPYRIDIQQGNVVTQDMVAKLKPGMSRQQVRFVLGTPPIVDPFHQDRWDYVYYLNKGGKVVEYRRLVLLFDGDTLKRIHGDVVPADSASTATNASPKAVGSAPAAPGSAPAEGSSAPAAASSPPAGGTSPVDSPARPGSVGSPPVPAAAASAEPSGAGRDASGTPPARSGPTVETSGEAAQAVEPAKTP